MKSIKSMFIAMIAVVAGVVAVGTSASAQCKVLTLPNGTQVTCIIVNGQKVYVDLSGNQYPATSTGNATFQATGTVINPCTQLLKPVSLSATGSNPTLGTVTTTLDGSRTPAASSVAANQAGSEFPATATINFYANATLSSKPGVNYRSIQQLTLQGKVSSFNPFKQERFVLLKSVDFEDVNRPGVVAFSLGSLTVTLN